MNKLYFIIIFSFFIISHFALPEFNNGKDFLIFTKWGMFRNSNYTVRDLTWDDGKTFFFRDHRDKYLHSFGDLLPIYHRSQKEDHTWLRRNLANIYKFCNCSEVYHVRLSGKLSDHIIHKKVNSIQSTTLL